MPPRETIRYTRHLLPPPLVALSSSHRHCGKTSPTPKHGKDVGRAQRPNQPGTSWERDPALQPPDPAQENGGTQRPCHPCSVGTSRHLDAHPGGHSVTAARDHYGHCAPSPTSTPAKWRGSPPTTRPPPPGSRPCKMAPLRQARQPLPPAKDPYPPGRPATQGTVPAACDRRAHWARRHGWAAGLTSPHRTQPRA